MAKPVGFSASSARRIATAVRRVERAGPLRLNRRAKYPVGGGGESPGLVLMQAIAFGAFWGYGQPSVPAILLDVPGDAYTAGDLATEWAALGGFVGDPASSTLPTEFGEAEVISVDCSILEGWITTGQVFLAWQIGTQYHAVAGGVVTIETAIESELSPLGSVIVAQNDPSFEPYESALAAFGGDSGLSSQCRIVDRMGLSAALATGTIVAAEYDHARNRTGGTPGGVGISGTPYPAVGDYLEFTLVAASC